MKAASVSEIKKELRFRSSDELEQLCLRLARFKKENKELLTYLLFEKEDEAGYVKAIMAEIDELFELINTDSYYYIKKSVRKILRNVKKYIRYSDSKETEVELLIYFCRKLKEFRPDIQGNVALVNLYERQLNLIANRSKSLHEDLQHDFLEEIEMLHLKPQK